MGRTEPSKLWWSPEELADARLPGMPGSKRGINRKAEVEGWQNHPVLARRKKGRGAGWQYHWELLPIEVRSALLLQDAEQSTYDPGSRDEAWAMFDQQNQRVKNEAEQRRKVLERVDAIYAAGHTHVSAVSAAAKWAGKSARTVYNWIALVEGVAVEDRLPYLAPKSKRAGRKAVDDEGAQRFMDFLKSSYLRLAGSTFKDCYRKAVREANKQGWEVLTERTAKRRIDADVPRVTQVFMREGVQALEQCFPAQIRDRSQLGAMGGVNADCHKIDVFVEWPDGTINRPQIVAFQDLYSNKILSWRVDHTPNSVMVMAAFGEMIEGYGIPRHCLFDNGREFANKWLTGGAPTRFRFTVREDDPLGVLPQLGIQIHWATPARGQSKPIERAFRDIASDVSKDPRFAGAYVGNRPDAKPENYASRAMPSDTLLEVLAAGIEEHNARLGRQTEVARGRSFDQTFEESYAEAPIRKATEEQRRLWLMGQQVCKLHAQNGSITFQRNVYHCDWMSNHAGRRVVARFNPENLHEGLSIYDHDGAYLGFAECQQRVGFFDLAGAQKQARRNAQIRRAEKQLAKAHAPLSVEEVAAAYDAHDKAPAAELEAKVVAPNFGGRAPRLPHQKPSYEPAKDAEVETLREAMIHELPVRAKASENQGGNTVPATPADRFWRVQELLKLKRRGKEIGQQEAEWMRRYIEGSEYQGTLAMFEAFGESGVR